MRHLKPRCSAKELRFPGIPYGHDVRFLTDEAFIQIDVKSTGPTDDADEVVSSPNQVTGDGFQDSFAGRMFDWHVVHADGTVGATSTGGSGYSY